MPFDAEQLGMQAASSAVNAGLGIVLGGINDARQVKQQQRLTDQQVAAQKIMTDYNRESQMKMWDYTNYENQVKHIENAGLNAGLMYGMGGGGGTTAGSASGSVSGGTAQQNPGEVQQMMQYGLQLKSQEAQIKLAESQAKNLDADTENKSEGGATRENIKADTANKIADQVIKDFTGKDVKDTYERVKAPNRSIEAETYMKELEARQGPAAVLYELWESGKLKEKSTAEVEQALLDNAKTRAEKSEIYKRMDLLDQNIQGQKFDNIMKELESKLQTQTGIDRNSPYWLKIVGRLFVQLFGSGN